MKKTTSSSNYFADYNSANVGLNIQFSNSSIDSCFQLHSPFQITLEYCSGTGENDYLNIVTLSPDNTYFAPAPYNFYKPFYEQRSLHYHDFYELMLVLKGEVIQQIEDKDYLYPVGTCCLINRNLRHSEKFTGESSVMFIGLSVDFIKELLSSYKTAYFDNEKALFNNPLFSFFNDVDSIDVSKAYLDFIPIASNTHGSDELYKLSDFMMQTMLHPVFGSTHIIKGLIYSVFQYLFDQDNYHSTYIELDSNADFLLFSRISHLLEDTYGRISRSSLEQTLNYSGDYINHIVNKYTGNNLFHYRMKFCLERVADLLKETDLSVFDIAQSLGFTNRTHFYKLFKERYGMTPKEFRKNHK